MERTDLETPRAPQLDGLRGLAVMAVVAHHTTRAAGPGHALSASGAAAVWLFFVLSGFLVTGILLDARRAAGDEGGRKVAAWRAFCMRRALRILPLYYAALAVAVATGVGDAGRDWPWLAAFLANWRFAAAREWPDATAHFWSLAVEEQFYVAWPAACLWLPRRWLAALAVAMVAAAPASRLLLAGSASDGFGASTLTPGCLDGLGLGAILAITRRPPRWHAAWIGAAVAAGWVAAQRLWLPALPSQGLDRLGFALAAWWLVGRAAWGFGGVAGRVLEWPPVAHAGRVSYGIYVIHAMVPPLCEWWEARSGLPTWLPPDRGASRFLYVAAASIGLASLSWRYFEGPINGLKRHFPYVRRSHK